MEINDSNIQVKDHQSIRVLKKLIKRFKQQRLQYKILSFFVIVFLALMIGIFFSSYLIWYGIEVQ